MRNNGFRDNILIKYTLISFALTVILASSLSWMISVQMRDQLIYTHGDFYRAYIRVIELNYTEIIPLIKSHTESETSGEYSHGHDEMNSPLGVWNHFVSDLVQFPYVKQFQILNNNGDIIWEFEINENLAMIDMHDNDIKSWSSGGKDFNILNLEGNLAVEYLIPIQSDGEQIGSVHLIDLDPDLQNKIRSTQTRAVSLIFAGGLIFYLSLFLLFYKVQRRQAITIDQLDQSQKLTIETMSRLAELRDDNTGAHIRRTSLYCRILATELSQREKKSLYLTKEYIRDLEHSAPLHDIGKVGVPDYILQKAGPLSVHEFEVIQKHPQMGADVLREASVRLGFQSFFELGYQIVLYHHENWDGSGYPEGLSGEGIPLSARIMSVADVYDALTTNRPYKDAFSHEEAIRIILGESGFKFDPQIIEALRNVSDQFKKIAKEFSDKNR